MRIFQLVFTTLMASVVAEEYPRAIMVTGSNFLDCQGVYYITYDTIVDETSTGESTTSNRPVYQSINGDRYIYYRSDQASMSLGDFQVTVDSGWRVGKSHGENSERVFYASGSNEQNPCHTGVDWISPENPNEKIRVNPLEGSGTVIFPQNHGDSINNEINDDINSVNDNKEYEDNSAAIDAVYDEIFNQPIYRGDTDPSRGPGLANGEDQPCRKTIKAWYSQQSNPLQAHVWALPKIQRCFGYYIRQTNTVNGKVYYTSVSDTNSQNRIGKCAIWYMAGPKYYRWIVGLTRDLGTDLGYIYVTSKATCPYQTGYGWKYLNENDQWTPANKGFTVWYDPRENAP